MASGQALAEAQVHYYFEQSISSGGVKVHVHVSFLQNR